jgi:4-amino-4-deoxy-L-arabinose transferase-like glycosyltransferase
MWRLRRLRATLIPAPFHGIVYWRVPPAQIIYNITNNPPLVNALIGLPLNLVLQPNVAVEPTIWDTGNAPHISQTFMWQTNPNGLQIIAVGRFGAMFLAMLLGALVGCWSWELWRRKTAVLLSLFLYTFDPNILAHGALATIDLGTAFFITLAAYWLWRYWRSPSSGGYVLAGVGIAFALAAKFSALTLVPAVIIASGYLLWPQRRQWTVWWKTVLRLVGWFGLATIVFLAIYRFDWVMLQHDFLWQQQHQLTGHPAYLLGKVSTAGWWYYFPIILLVKTPLSVLLLAGGGLVLFAGGKRYDGSRLWVLLIIGGVLAASMLTKVNIGYRYLLPALPMLYAFLGQLALWEYAPHPVLRKGIALALLGLVLSSCLIHPHYLAYFNVLAGGPDNGWRVAVDSNIEWGQDMAALPDYLAKHQIETIYGMWMTMTPPEVYGLNVQPLARSGALQGDALFNPERPSPGTYILGVSHLQGAFDEEIGTTFAWFRQRAPDDKIGYSLFVYEVEPDGPPVTIALSGVSVNNTNLADFHRNLSSNDLRQGQFNARSSLLWLGGGGVGAEDVWTAVAVRDWPTHPQLQAFYPTAEVKCLVRPDQENYQLFHWPESPINTVLQSTSPQLALNTDFGYTTEPVVGSTAWVENRHPLIGKAFFGEVVEMLGYQQWPNAPLSGGESLELLSYWRVQNPPQANLTIFVHLLDANGQIVAQSDRLDVDTRILQSDDEFVQLHQITLPDRPGTYALQMGVYDTDTMVRLPLPTPVGPVDRLLLHSFTVR